MVGETGAEGRPILPVSVFLRICPAARHFRGIDSAHLTMYRAGINSADIKRGNGTPGHVYPVTFIAAPLYFISNGILYRRPVNLQRFNANPLINHGIRLNNDIGWRALLPWRNNADWSTINNRTESILAYLSGS